MQRAEVLVNLAAIERNCQRLAALLEPQTRLCAVVKADAYGHGATACAPATLQGGADWLAVATAQEAATLRAALPAARILILGCLSARDLEQALLADADIVAWSAAFLDRARGLGGARMHVKLDTGMGRAGTRDSGQATALVEAIAADPRLELAGVMTHFATADEADRHFIDLQLRRFDAWSHQIKAQFPEVIVHAANSAATLRERLAHYDMVRCGIAVYGLDPFGQDASAHDLEPALALRSYVAALKPCATGESVGYGRRFIARASTTIAIVPIGYGDGYRRALTNNAEVLIGGRRYPLVGTISMDSITVDLGRDSIVAQGDRVVLIGRDRLQRITAEQIAQRLGTITHEVTCGFTSRVARRHHRDCDHEMP